MARFAVKPPTEVKLSELQALYLASRNPLDYTDSVYYQEIFKELVPYTNSLILKQIKGKIYLPPEIIEDAAIEASMKFMEQYEKPEFAAHSSFAGYIHYKILETLYSPKKIREDSILSLNSTLEGPDDKTEMEDWASKLKFHNAFRPEEELEKSSDPSEYLFKEDRYVIATASSILQDIFKSSASFVSAIRIAVGLLLFVRNTRFSKYQTSYLSREEQEVLTLCIVELRKRLSGEDD